MTDQTPAARRRRRRRAVADVVHDDPAYGAQIRYQRDGALQVRWTADRRPEIALMQVRGMEEAVEMVVTDLIARCRLAGLSWDDVAGILGYSRPAVVKRYGAGVAAALRAADDPRP